MMLGVSPGLPSSGCGPLSCFLLCSLFCDTTLSARTHTDVYAHVHPPHICTHTCTQQGCVHTHTHVNTPIFMLIPGHTPQGFLLIVWWEPKQGPREGRLRGVSGGGRVGPSRRWMQLRGQMSWGKVEVDRWWCWGQNWREGGCWDTWEGTPTRPGERPGPASGTRVPASRQSWASWNGGAAPTGLAVSPPVGALRWGPRGPRQSADSQDLLGVCSGHPRHSCCCGAALLSLTPSPGVGLTAHPHCTWKPTCSRLPRPPGHASLPAALPHLPPPTLCQEVPALWVPSRRRCACLL